MEYIKNPVSARTSIINIPIIAYITRRAKSIAQMPQEVRRVLLEGMIFGKGERQRSGRSNYCEISESPILPPQISF